MIATAVTSAASFDTGLSPEATRDLLAAAESPAAPAGSWLRLRDMPRAMVRDATGAEVAPWPEAKSAVSIAERRVALQALRDRGYRLVAILQWPATSWAEGTRPDQPLRRLPLDLREAYERCRRLAATYGDLIDYWEVENEPDISFVEENPETYAAFLKACYLGFKEAATDGGGRRTEDGEQTADDRRQMTDVRRQTADIGGRESDASSPGFAVRSLSSVSTQPSVVGHPSSGRVLNAAFALPPGPYFEAWLANDGLRFTDGFNYHYYGYAEDFTGVYQQFEEAVTKATAPAAADEAVLQTNFYFPGSRQTRSLSQFAIREGPVETNRRLLQSRPLATAEPALQAQGRWLVSTGTTVKETAEGWEFTVNSPAPEPLRPAMAELPLPDAWLRTDDGGRTSHGEGRATGPGLAAASIGTTEGGGRRTEAGGQTAGVRDSKSEIRDPRSPERGWADASLAFEYRTEKAEGGDLKPEVFSEAEHSSHQPQESVRSTRIVYSEISGLRAAAEAARLVPGSQQGATGKSQVSALPAARLRELPVFLTEYGYGRLDKEARDTAAGREAQRAWFAAVRAQIDALQIEGPMAFILRPYLEANAKEFGLLEEEARGKGQEARKAQPKPETGNLKPENGGLPNEGPWSGGAGSMLGSYVISPALAELLAHDSPSQDSRPWTVSTPAPGPVVLDIAGGSGLQMGKSYRGYFLRAGSAEAQLLVYNFGPAPVSGELALEGGVWTLAGGSRAIRLTLAPGERREIALAIHPEETARFGAQVAIARFRAGGTASEVAGPPSAVRPPPSVVSRPSLVASPPAPVGASSEFEVYLRTQNGNLYQTWPRLQARESWQWYAEPLANFTPAFYGRAHRPAVLAKNRPAALVFFFRPEKYPATYLVRHAQVVEYGAAPKRGE